MNCAITGAVPVQPVVSRKSGALFEKRNIEDYIAQNGSDPVTGEELSPDDLIEIKTQRAAKPRPPTLTSIPSLLQAFQNEWDALALESYTLKQQLAQTRQELSTALYDFEGAMRVIANLTKERDEARDALSKVTVTGVSNGDGDEMMVDTQHLPGEVIQKAEAAAKELEAGRKKRPVPAGWVTSEEIQAFKTEEIPDTALSGAKALASDKSGELVLFGGIDGVANLYSVSEKKTTVSIKCGSGAITDALLWRRRAVIALSTGEVKVFESDGTELATAKAHAGACTGLSLHPAGELLLSVGVDKSYVIYEIGSLKVLTRVFTDSALNCAHFHPDGRLVGVGGQDGTLRIYQVLQGQIAANFNTGGPLRSINFSENGYFVASTSGGSKEVSIFDLRNGSLMATIRAGGEVFHAKWDLSGLFLAIASAGSVSIEKYSKKSKAFSSLLSVAVPATDIAWGESAKSVMVLTTEGSLVSLA